MTERFIYLLTYQVGMGIRKEITMKQLTEQTKIEVAEGKQESLDMDTQEAICDDCGRAWNSEYHASDQCINPTDEDREVEGADD